MSQKPTKENDLRKTPENSNDAQQRENSSNGLFSEKCSWDLQAENPAEPINALFVKTGSGTIKRRRFLGGMGVAAIIAAVVLAAMGCKESSGSEIDVDGGSNMNDDGSVDGGPGSEPSQVTGLVQTGATSSLIAFSWDPASNANFYRVFLDGALSQDNVAGTDTTITGLAAETVYSVRVAGVNDVGEGEKSDPVTMSTVVSYEDLLCPTGTYTNGSPCEELAFPTAEGFGRYTKGGRGGQVVKITTLDGDGVSEGSLRYALEYLSGPRIVVFDVAGEIELSSGLTIENGHITIAGQTAPGQGITIRGAGLNILDGDVIMRHIRVRPGDDYTYSSAPDAINITGYSGNDISNMIFDHMSLSWALDEVFSTWPRSATQGDITLQNSLVYEGLRYSKHEQGGSHSRGILIGTGSERVSVLKNLLAHNRRRNPMVNPDTSDIDYINNVVYNWGEFKLGAAMQIYLPLAGINILNNYYKSGPDSTHGSGGCAPPYAYSSDDCNEPLYGRSSYYYFPGSGDVTITDNVFDDGSGPEDARISSPCFNEPSCAAKYLEDSPDFDLRDTPLREPEGVTNIMSGLDVYDSVLANSGTTVPFRDPIDTRVIDEVQTGTGGIIDSPNPLPARALPFATLGTNFFTGLGDMADGYDWSGANSESFNVGSYTVTLDEDCTNQGSSEANLQCVLDMINADLPSNIIAYNPTDYTNMYRVGIKTADVGSSQSLTISGSAVFDRFWISEGTYYGFDGVQNTDGSTGYAPIESGTPQTDSDDDGIPDSWENLHCLNPLSDDSADYDLSAIYTNIEVYLNDLAGDFGGTLESQCP